MTAIGKTTAKGQTTIPQDIRAALGVGPGDLLAWEVIADGSIHIYAPLRGRALAGASGAAEARIFTTRFEAELVSIAGVYRTFESGIPEKLAGRPAQIRLSGSAEDASSNLTIESLATD